MTRIPVGSGAVAVAALLCGAGVAAALSLLGSDHLAAPRLLPGPSIAQPREASVAAARAAPRSADPEPAGSHGAHPAGSVEPETPAIRTGERKAAHISRPRVRVRDAVTLAEVLDALVRFEAAGAAGAGSVIVEANGYHPARRSCPMATASAPDRTIDVLLVPAEAPPGIVLLARDSTGEPVEHLSVDASIVLRQPNSEPLVRPLWSRYTRGNEGRHELPSAPAGEVELRIGAADAEHRLRPLCTERRTFVVDGRSAVADEVVFAPGAVPWLEFVRADGRGYDPEADGVLTLRVVAPDGSTPAIRWLQGFGTGTRGAEDAVPGIGPVWPSESLAPGTYLLSVWVRSELRARRPLHLDAGQSRLERVVVP